MAFLDSLVSPKGLFGPAVDGFTERFTEAQKTSQALPHFLPKRSSTATVSSRPKPASTQQPAKPAQPQLSQKSEPGLQRRSRSAKRYPFPKRQGPRPRVTLDPGPQKLSWSACGEEEESVNSCRCQNPLEDRSQLFPTPLNASEWWRCCNRACPVNSVCAPNYRCDSGPTYNKEQISSPCTHTCQFFPCRWQTVISKASRACLFSPFGQWTVITKGKITHEDQLPARRAALCENVYKCQFSPVGGDMSLIKIEPLASWLSAWKAIPGVSSWVLETIERGYSLQFTRSPPAFRGVVQTFVQDNESHVLRAEIRTMLAKGAVETVPLADSESGFYSRNFLVPKKDGGLRPILDLRLLNRALVRRLFRMLTLKQILAQIRPEDWLLSVDLKDAYFHIQIAPRHRPFLRFAFEGTAYQYTVLPFGLSLAPRTFTKYIDAALSPLRQMGICILNYLDDWLVLAESERQLITHRSLLLNHLERLGLKINPSKSFLFPRQWASFLGTIIDSVQMRAWITPERSLTIQRAASFKLGTSHPLKAFQRMLGLMATASSVIPLGLLHMRPLQYWLKACVQSHAWRLGRTHVKVTHRCLKAVAPWTTSRLFQSGVELGTTSRRKVVTTDASSSGWGALHEGNPAYGSWTTHERRLYINCLEMMAVCLALKTFLPALRGHHVLVRSDNTTVVAYINHQGGLRSRPLHRMTQCLLLWAQKEFLSSDSCAGQIEPRSGYVVKRQCSSGGMEATSSEGSIDLVSFRQGRGRPLRLRRQLSLPNLFLEAAGCSGPRLAQHPPVRIPTDRPATPGYQVDQGNKVLSPSRGPPLEEPSLVPRDDPAAGCSTVVNSTMERSSLSSAGQDLASPARTVEPSCLADRREVDRLPMGVANTILEARAPSTRRLYALKWSVFSNWCSARNQDAISCDVSHVLIFLQELLDKGCTSSTLKVYVAAIAANHSTKAGRTIGRN